MTDMGVLRAIKDTEVELMRAWRNAPGVRLNMYSRHEISREEHLSWWAGVQSREDQQYFMYCNQDVPTGIVAFTGIDLIGQNSSWAFYASPDAAKGTGTKMEFLAIDYAFSGLMRYKLYCEVLAYNRPVIKLHQKFGFKIEGVFREHHKIDEAFVDIYRFGLLGAEWTALRPQMAARLNSFLRG